MKEIIWKNRATGPSTASTKSIMIHYPDMDLTLTGRFSIEELKQMIKDAEEYLKEQDNANNDQQNLD